MRQQEQQRLAKEQDRVSTLASEKQELEVKLAAISRRAPGTPLQKLHSYLVALQVLSLYYVVMQKESCANHSLLSLLVLICFSKSLSRVCAMQKHQK